MLLSDLQNKDIINLIDGRKMGSIIDINISKEGHIFELIIQKKIFFIFNSSPLNIKWEQIEKIGTDVILVNIKN